MGEIEVTRAVAWVVAIVMAEAAIIDGRQLRVPNWLTYHFALGGLAYAAWAGGWGGLAWSAVGLAAGLGLLLPLYAIGGMGAGDVKLLAGVGAWVGPWLVFGAFATSAFVGAAMALVMVARSGAFARHRDQFFAIGQEILTVRDPVLLAETAAARKPTMMLLPYGIPLAIGSIGYLAWLGLLY